MARAQGLIQIAYSLTGAVRVVRTTAGIFEIQIAAMTPRGRRQWQMRSRAVTRERAIVILEAYVRRSS